MSQRFFSDQPITGDRATLADSEAHHLIHVMRAAPGDLVTLFDGSGSEFDASVARIGRREVELEVLARREVDREAAMHLTLAAPLPKGDRSRWLVEKAVELGVAQIIPLITARSTGGKEKGVEKLDRFVIEASKQCGRNRLLQIAAPLRFDQLLQTAPRDARRLIAHPPHGDADNGAVERELNSPVIVALGPEGGFSDDEIQAAVASDWRIVSLGPRILRVETAALAIAARLL
jgi:16S rRNA (uracil1498-N3)-methyltransferase